MIYKLLFVGINFIDVSTSLQAHTKYKLPDTKILMVCYIFIYNFSSYECYVASTSHVLAQFVWDKIIWIPEMLVNDGDSWFYTNSLCK